MNILLLTQSISSTFCTKRFHNTPTTSYPDRAYFLLPTNHYIKMLFQTLLTFPLLFLGVFSAPTTGDLLIERSDLAVGQTGAAGNAEKICVFGKCINVGPGGPRCNIDRRFSTFPHSNGRIRDLSRLSNLPISLTRYRTECLASQTGSIFACAYLQKDRSIFAQGFCAAGILNLGLNMVCPYPYHES